MIPINPLEVEWLATRAQGPGGQNVNKVSTALHLRYDIRASSLPEAVKDRLLRSGDQRISTDGVLVIKAQRYRSRNAIARTRSRDCNDWLMTRQPCRCRDGRPSRHGARNAAGSKPK